MAVTEFNIAVGNDKVAATKNTSCTAVTGGASTLGGTTAVRLLVDDAVAPSKLEVMRALEVLEGLIVENKWPIQ